jgi:hypothetical protein
MGMAHCRAVDQLVPGLLTGIQKNLPSNSLMFLLA